MWQRPTDRQKFNMNHLIIMKNSINSPLYWNAKNQQFPKAIVKCIFLITFEQQLCMYAVYSSNVPLVIAILLWTCVCCSYKWNEIFIALNGKRIHAAKRPLFRKHCIGAYLGSIRLTPTKNWNDSIRSHL